jgi:hypothetical protein
MAIEKVLTPEFRAAFADVWKARAYEDGEPKFGLVMVFPKTTDISALKRAAEKVAREKWGDKLPELMKAGKIRLPWREGSEYGEYDGFDDSVVFIRATSKRPPGIVDRSNQRIIDQSEFYSGCFARATVNAFAYETKGNRGVSFGLLNLQKIRDGESFAGAANPEQDFEPLAGEDGVAAPAADEGDSLFG